MYYVYQLIDPLTKIPFYIGKGKGNRAAMHLKESEWWYNKRKGAKIKSLLNENLKPIIEIVFESENEDDVKYEEERLIKMHGRRGIDKGGILTNLCISAHPPTRKNKPGTFAGKKHTEETKSKLRTANQKQFSNQSVIENHSLKSKKLWQDKNYREKQSKSRVNMPATKPSAYRVYFSDDNFIEIVNLDKWCRENNYPVGTLRDTLPQRKGKPSNRGKAKGMYIIPI